MNRVEIEKKILFITPHDFFDLCGNGGVKVTRRNYDLLEKHFGENNISLGVFRAKRHATPSRSVSAFEQPHNRMEMLLASLWGCMKYLPWQEKKIVKKLQSKETDLLFVDSSTLGKLTGKKISPKVVAFFHNVEIDYSWNKVKNEGLHFFPSFFAARINEKCAIRKADKIGCLNERDAARIEKIYGRKVDFYLPVTFDDQFDIEKTKKDYKKEILFFGSFFPPNQLGVEWFIKNVMPELQDVTLNIVGKGFECKKKEYERYHNVKVIGTVENPEEYYYRHAVVIMPIQYGSGMKVKTAEAMMYGRIILASDEALEGYEIEGVKGIYRCNTAEEYIAQINTLFENNTLSSYQEEVRELFLKKYETKQVEERFERIITALFNE